MQKMLRNKPSKQLMAEINVVPYIDVMLVLLVIFMITAPMLTQGLSVDLPQASADPLNIKPQEEPLIVTIASGGEYFINTGDESESKTLADIKIQVQKIIQQREKLSVLINGDKSVSYADVVSLMAILQELGVESVGLITDPVIVD